MDEKLRLLPILRRLNYDDALHFISVTKETIFLSPYRLEYLYLFTGWAHYRVYEREKLIGMVDIRGAGASEKVLMDLSAYLHQLGFTPAQCRIIRSGATTPMDAPTSRCPRLFKQKV
jgi:hypothetical protein